MLQLFLLFKFNRSTKRCFEIDVRSPVNGNKMAVTSNCDTLTWAIRYIQESHHASVQPSDLLNLEICDNCVVDCVSPLVGVTILT